MDFFQLKMFDVNLTQKKVKNICGSKKSEINPKNKALYLNNSF